MLPGTGNAMWTTHDVLMGPLSFLRAKDLRRDW